MKNTDMRGEAGGDTNMDDSEEEKGLPHPCPICNKRFKESSALGGHISKAHPGQSTAYNHKKRVRDARELERTLHREAMDLYQAELNNLEAGKDNVSTENGAALNLTDKKSKDLALNRNAIKRIKKDLVRLDDKYENLREKFLGGQTSTSAVPLAQFNHSNGIQIVKQKSSEGKETIENGWSALPATYYKYGEIADEDEDSYTPTKE